MEVEKLIEKFKSAALMHHQFTLEGNWRKANEQIKKINEANRKITELGRKDLLLNLTDSDLNEVASMAAVYCMRYDPEKCLETLQTIANKNIPLISSGAEQAIKNWKNKEWDIA
jgi:hypothetical protein